MHKIWKARKNCLPCFADSGFIWARLPFQYRMSVLSQALTGLRADVALSGAAALERAAHLDAAAEILARFRASAGASSGAATAEAQLRLCLSQVSRPVR